MAMSELEYSMTRDQRRAERIRQARLQIENTGEAGDNFPVCSGACGELAESDPCEFCERHVLQHDGSWVVQTLA